MSHRQLRRTVLAAVAGLLIATAPPPATAIEPGMPNPPASPTRVQCGLIVTDVIAIDDINETFEAEITLIASWSDPRLAFDADAEETEVKIFQGEYQFAELFAGWWPQFLIVNQAGRGDTSAIKIEVHPDGTVRYLEQRNMVLETPMSLHDYPFDSQRLRALLIPFGNTVDEVVLETDGQLRGSTEDYIRREQSVNVAGWNLLGLDAEVDEISLLVSQGRRSFSRLVVTIHLERRSWQLVWEILFPLLILVSVVWSVFWIDIESLTDRLNISFIGVLTIVAYQFVVVENLPRMSYLTFTDSLLLVSFLMMAATIPQSLWISSLVRAGRQAEAKRIDRISRWAFPTVYLLLTVGLYTWHRIT